MKITLEKFKDFQNKWVALDENTETIVASGKDLIQVQLKASKKSGKNAPIVLKYIYPFNSYLAPSVQ